MSLFAALRTLLPINETELQAFFQFIQETNAEFVGLFQSVFGQEPNPSTWHSLTRQEIYQLLLVANRLQVVLPSNVIEHIGNSIQKTIAQEAWTGSNTLIKILLRYNKGELTERLPWLSRWKKQELHSFASDGITLTFIPFDPELQQFLKSNKIGIDIDQHRAAIDILQKSVGSQVWKFIAEKLAIDVRHSLEKLDACRIPIDNRQQAIDLINQLLSA